MVVPERHDKDVSASKRSTHSVVATEVSEAGSVAEDALLRLAERVGDGVSSDAGDLGIGVLEHLPVLDVEALDVTQSGSRANELRDNSHLSLSVELHAGPVEVLHAHAVGVEVAAVLVAHALVAVVAVTAVCTCALDETSTLAGVGGVSSGNRVGFPDVHLRTASTNGASAGVAIVGGGHPARAVGLAVDPLDVVGALGVAVSCNASVCGWHL